MGLAVLAVHCVVIAIFSIVGGQSSHLFVLKHAKIQMLMSFIAGFIISIAINHLLPHSFELLLGDNLGEVSVWVLLGVVAMVLLLRIFHFQQYEFSEEEKMESHLEHKSERKSDTSSGPCFTSLVGVVIGLGFHAILEGITLGTAIQLGINEGKGVLAGFGFFLAILLHKPIDAYSIIGMMRSCGYSKTSCHVVNILFAICCPLVALLTFWGVRGLSFESFDPIMGRVMAFATGAFICISLSDLLPEIQKHRHDSIKLALVFFRRGFAALSHAYLCPLAITYYSCRGVPSKFQEGLISTPRWTRAVSPTSMTECCRESGEGQWAVLSPLAVIKIVLFFGVCPSTPPPWLPESLRP